ncbi:MAG: nuclear transport factor 2 family protein [Bacteroidota bacterium]
MKPSLALFVLCLLGHLPIYSQIPADPSTEQQVNKQLWKPFKKAYESRDWEAFNALHTDDVLRINRWSGIRQGAAYKESNRKHFQQKTDSQKTIDFRLEHRLYSDDMGYEVGYYRIRTQKEGEETKEHYARFHVRLQKVDGQWQIAQDWDVDNINGRPITAEDFNKGTPLDLD